MMQQSAMNQSKLADAKNANNKSAFLTGPSPAKRNGLAQSVRLTKVNGKEEDSISQGNRSTTTQGGGLANKIGQAVSRILSQTMNQDITDEDEVQDLIGLLNELNAHHDLTWKLANQSKIVKFLSEAAD